MTNIIVIVVVQVSKLGGVAFLEKLGGEYGLCAREWSTSRYGGCSERVAGRRCKRWRTGEGGHSDDYCLEPALEAIEIRRYRLLCLD